MWIIITVVSHIYFTILRFLLNCFSQQQLLNKSHGLHHLFWPQKQNNIAGGCNTSRLWLNTKKEPQSIQVILRHRHDRNSYLTNVMHSQMLSPSACLYPKTQTHMWCPDTLMCTQTYHLFPVGSRPGANCHLDTRVRRSKSLFCWVDPLLFIHETKRKGWRDSDKEKDREESLSEAFDVENNLFFNLPSNGIHMTHLEPVHTVCQLFSSLSFSLCLLVCACVCCARTRFCDVHTCAR